MSLITTFLAACLEMASCMRAPLWRALTHVSYAQALRLFRRGAAKVSADSPCLQGEGIS